VSDVGETHVDDAFHQQIVEVSGTVHPGPYGFHRAGLAGGNIFGDQAQI